MTIYIYIYIYIRKNSFAYAEDNDGSAVIYPIDEELPEEF